MFWLVWMSLLAATPTVENGVQPEGKPWRIKFEETLRINQEEVVDEALWTGPAQVVQTDSKGNLYVMDQRESRLVMFDAKGKFGRQIGARGQGPGEFLALVHFQIFADDSAYVFENQGAVTRVTAYAPGFEYQWRKQIQMPVFPRHGIFSPDKKWMATTVTRIDNQRSKEITKYLLVSCDFEKPEFTIGKELLHWESMSLDNTRLNDSNHWAEFLGERFYGLSKGYNAFAVFDSQGRAYTAKADAYEITRLDSNLKPELSFGRKYKPIPMGQTQIDALVLPIRESILQILPPNLQEVISINVVKRATELAGFPKAQFPIAGLRLIDDQTLLVIHGADPASRENRGDLFDTDGHYRGSFTMQNNALMSMVFRNGTATTVETDGDDNNSIVRYRLVIDRPGTM